MKRMLATLTVLAGLAAAQAPAYPENTVGVGYGFNRGLTLQGSLGLPFSPLGIDTGLDVEAILPNAPSVWVLAKANLLPALTVGDLPMSVGLGLDLRYINSGFGIHLEPLATLEVPGGAISASLGLGYQDGFHLAYGLGARFYLDPVALEAATSDRYPLKISLLYLW
ncbi:MULTISPECIES: bioflim formation protein [unclassified Meiothermus]|uniref:bioflim formation protein n=1 Tax=unclassified Meiothermus TaxID=370471 RepID=UPI000D7BE27D|nr:MULTISPECIES: bioflim formation protein [unclassified Meiothermus]PZA06309.1 bioflim formation protein [Meiothermus sp. Pnk-1]RYM39507.1 bioflim formation protein [Meiothermus sp. PNK-Is4]